MFNTNFSNKTQLKIKNIFFILLDRIRFNAFLALNPTDPTGTVEHSLKNTHEQWSMTPQFMSFPAQETTNSCFLQTCGCAIINSRPYQYKYIVGALPNSWVVVVASNAKATTQPITLTHVWCHHGIGANLVSFLRNYLCIRMNYSCLAQPHHPCTNYLIGNNIRE